MPYDDMVSRLALTIGGLEWIAVFSFVAFSFVYFLAPVLGYAGEKRGMLLLSLYVLLGYGLLVLFQMILMFLIALGSSNSGNLASAKAVSNLSTIFAILKLLLIVASQGCFILGLQGLRRNSAGQRSS